MYASPAVKFLAHVSSLRQAVEQAFEPHAELTELAGVGGAGGVGSAKAVAACDAGLAGAGGEGSKAVADSVSVANVDLMPLRGSLAGMMARAIASAQAERRASLG